MADGWWHVSSESSEASARVLLESEGFHVVGEAVDGASAVKETCRLRPQLVLLDVQLPDIDGFDVAQRITVVHQGRVFAEGSVDEITEHADVRRIYLGKA